MSLDTDPRLHLNLIFIATIFTRIFQSVLGFLRLGIVADFLSNSTIIGIMSGTVIMICLQQLNCIFGPSHFSTKTDVISILHAVFKRQDEDNVLGEGGFGRVYRGVLPDREEVAVKRLEVGRGQGEREFLTEVEIISRVHHKHVVSLVGYCTTMSERILVFDYVPNGSLKSHLHGEGRPTLGWTARMKIAVGSAKGLQYLHEDCHPTIIHRDIKAANILVNFDFEAKIADFGFAKYASESNNGESRLVGTIGYFAPEYASSGELTPNADTFSFGVVLLELITGRRPVGSPHNSSNYNLAFSMRPHLTQALQDGNFDFLVDPRLHNNYDPSEMTRMVACAAACVRESAQHRPRMSLVARVLEGYQSAADLDDGTGAGPSNL